MPHFSDDPGADEDPEFLSRFRLMLGGLGYAPGRLPDLKERFGLPRPRDPAHQRQDAALVGADPSPAASRRPPR